MTELQSARMGIVTDAMRVVATDECVDAYGVSADLRTYRERVRWEAREVLARCKDVFFVETRQPVAGMPAAAQDN